MPTLTRDSGTLHSGPHRAAAAVDCFSRHPVVIPIYLQITLFFTHPVVCIYVEIEITFNIFLLSLEMPLIDDMHSLVQEKEARGR